MTTNEYVATRPLGSESPVRYHDSSSINVVPGWFRGWLESLRRQRAGRSLARTSRPRQHARRVDFVERAAMAREMHRL